MTLPMQLQREAEQLAQLEQAIYAPQPNPEASPPAEEAPAPVQPVAEVPAPAPVTPPAPPAVDWEQKYKSLQGVFNSQVPTLQSQIKEMQAEMARLREAKAPEPPKPDADPKDTEVFGADVVDMVVRTTKGIVMPLMTDLQTRLAKLETLAQDLTKTSGATAEEVFFDRLEAKVPQWETINKDPRFVAWLDEVDPVYREPRRMALNYARQNLDVEAVASIFTVFAKLIQPPAPAAAAPRPSLEQQVSPGTGAGSPTPTAPPAKPIITQAEITRFFNELAQGRWKGREQAAAAREAEINLAVAEGRIR